MSLSIVFVLSEQLHYRRRKHCYRAQAAHLTCFCCSLTLSDSKFHEIVATVPVLMLLSCDPAGVLHKLSMSFMKGCTIIIFLQTNEASFLRGCWHDTRLLFITQHKNLPGKAVEVNLKLQEAEGKLVIDFRAVNQAGCGVPCRLTAVSLSLCLNSMNKLTCRSSKREFCHGELSCVYVSIYVLMHTHVKQYFKLREAGLVCQLRSLL